MRAVRAVLIGAGNRGMDPFGVYAQNHPGQIRFVAVVDRDPARRAYFAQLHRISEKHRFASVEAFINSPTKVDAVVNATTDQDHLKTILPFLKLDMPILLEKPIATSPQDCELLHKRWKEGKAKVMVCHELRYAPLYTKIKELISSGELGSLRMIEMIENIGNWHFAHSYVRGNWRSTKVGPISLTKTCHDFDIMTWLMGEDEVVTIRSIAPELHFRIGNAPTSEVPHKCHEGCPVAHACEYYAPRVYLREAVNDPYSRGFMLRAINPSGDMDKLKSHLEEGNYSRCVYRCDNNVPDYQLTEIVCKSGLKIFFKMTAWTPEINRRIKVLGENGVLKGSLLSNHLERIGYKKRTYDLPDIKGSTHGGGDERLIRDFVKLVRNENPSFATPLDTSIYGHLLAFAAEESRIRDGKKIDFIKWLRLQKYPTLPQIYETIRKKIIRGERS
jgi:hypothetical protein